MHSRFEMPGIHPPENTAAPGMLSVNQTHILDQIHSLPANHQQPFQLQHFIPTHHHHQFVSPPTAYFPPVNFKLGLNEVCATQPPPPPQHQHSLGILHCWQSQQEDSAIKPQQQPFWEPLAAEASNENSEIVDRQEQPPPCLDPKNRVHFGELEAIYKHASANLPSSEATTILEEDEEEEEDDEQENKTMRKRKRKKQGGYSYSKVITPMAEFFGNLMKQMMDHQENLHRKFTEMIERLDEERRAREETWRNQELAQLEKEAEARSREKHLARNREAIIVSYLEKISGQTQTPPKFSSFQNPVEITSTSQQRDLEEDIQQGLMASK